jgi:hypothetical protein
MKIKSKSQHKRAKIQVSDFAKDFPHWNICEPCAVKKGARWGKDGGIGITMTSGFCPYCDQKATLIPLSDFEWPAYKKKAIFD